MTAEAFNNYVLFAAPIFYILLKSVTRALYKKTTCYIHFHPGDDIQTQAFNLHNCHN